MKHAVWIALLIAMLAGGCQRTVSPRTFVFMLRHIDPPGQPGGTGWISKYDGDDEKYYYLEYRVSDPYHRSALTLRYCDMKARDRIRCLKTRLPDSFPAGIEPNWTETPEDSMRYAEEYLRRHKLGG